MVVRDYKIPILTLKVAKLACVECKMFKCTDRFIDGQIVYVDLSLQIPYIRESDVWKNREK